MALTQFQSKNYRGRKINCFPRIWVCGCFWVCVHCNNGGGSDNADGGSGNWGRDCVGAGMGKGWNKTKMQYYINPWKNLLFSSGFHPADFLLCSVITSFCFLECLLPSYCWSSLYFSKKWRFKSHFLLKLSLIYSVQESVILSLNFYCTYCLRTLHRVLSWYSFILCFILLFYFNFLFWYH